ncbi:hypothetical protein QBC34DRAFT_379601 [Podospora aff. communis PSN243]|uniref:F-box domain-containing protein n=1 Tax=Podospora aff. communis PSN243 TaxID=3040156 RepID=A0AAV9GPR5_9PEZI|nr:hypothetical protein QBC34DRAFT_379601 [Podospora aff. communis PSN243]
MATKSMVHAIPQEVEDMIWRRAFTLPGIHFFSLARNSNLRYSEYFVGAEEGHRKLLPPRPRPEDNPLWWSTPEELPYNLDRSSTSSTRTTFFDAKNPSAYTHRSNLREVCESSDFEITRTIDDSAGWVGMDLVRIRDLYNLRREGVQRPYRHGAIQINTKTDIVCFQIPNRMSHRQFFGSWFSAAHGKFSCAFPEFLHLKKLVVEWRPRRRDAGVLRDWPEDWTDADSEMASEYPTHEPSDSDSDSDESGWGFDDSIHLGDHFPELEEVFFLDYAVRLRKGMAPSEKARRWCGGVYDFVEVLVDDEVWEREKDGFPGSVEEYDAASAIADVKEHHVLLENVLFDLEGAPEVRIMARVLR